MHIQQTDQRRTAMNTHLSMLVKSFVIALTAVAVLALSPGVARADEVTISGFTTGIVTAPQLLFAGNNSFTGTTALGIGSLSGVNSLGSFFLEPGDLQLVSGDFTLNITFTSPTGINGGQGATYLATIFGSVSPNVDQGGVTIAFENATQLFTFSDDFTSGFFTLTVPETLFVQTGRSADLTAGITGQQVVIPEPATLILLGSGLTGVAAKLRKRRKERAQREAI
jgi:hypothetical protein